MEAIARYKLELSLWQPSTRGFAYRKTGISRYTMTFFGFEPIYGAQELSALTTP